MFLIIRKIYLLLYRTHVNLKTDKQKMVHFLEQQIHNQDESYLRQYRENLPHL